MVQPVTDLERLAALDEPCRSGFTIDDPEETILAAKLIAAGRPWVLLGNSYHPWDCTCHGTGKVARFRDAQGKPLLRVADIGNGWSHAQCVGTSGCDLIAFNRGNCQGRGWVPVQPECTTEALLEAFDSIHFNHINWSTYQMGEHDWVCVVEASISVQSYGPKVGKGNGTTATEARQAALAAALWDAEEARNA